MIWFGVDGVILGAYDVVSEHEYNIWTGEICGVGAGFENE